MFLYAFRFEDDDEDDPITFVAGESLEKALAKYRKFVVAQVQKDYDNGGCHEPITEEDVEEPSHVQFVAGGDYLVL